MTSSLPLRDHHLTPQPVALAAEELLSALVDGEASGAELTTALAACGRDPALSETWAHYHWLGDALRAPGAVAHAGDAGFVSRFSQRLAAEGVAPAAPPVLLAAPVQASAHDRGVAANDGLFRWKLVAGFASLAAVSAIAWNAAGLMGTSTQGAPQLAQASTQSQPVLVSSPQGVMVRDARLEELLAAHRQLGGGSALEAPSGFLRNAAFEPSQSAGR